MKVIIDIPRAVLRRVIALIDDKGVITEEIEKEILNVAEVDITQTFKDNDGDGHILGMGLLAISTICADKYPDL